MLRRILRPARRNEGYVLVWVIFCFLLFYLIAISFVDSSSLVELISSNYYRAAQAFEMADGGILAGLEQVYSILEKDYSYSPDIPAKLILPKQEWILHESGKELRVNLSNPKCIYIGDNEWRFEFTSRGVSFPAQRVLAAEIQVEFTVVYKIENDANGGAVAVFDHREFIYPAKVVLLQYKND